MTIAVDFDGTIVEHLYPEIGKEIPFATDTLKMLIKEHHKLILWTVREGKLLDDAINWCRERGVEFYAVNRDYPEETVDNNQHFTRLGHHLSHDSSPQDVERHYRRGDKQLQDGVIRRHYSPQEEALVAVLKVG